MISSKTSNDLFNKIRSKFGNIQIGNAMGEATSNPGDAVFFDFDFQEDGDSFGRVSISIADGECVKVFYNQGLVEKIDEDSRAEWYAFLKELKDFAVTHQLGFDVRDITKNGLKQQDFKNLADQNKTVNTDGMSEELSRITKLAGLAEGLTGTARSSFENLDKTRLIIRHSKAVDENIPGDRTRNINSLYIENQDGERFKYPVIHLAGARAMARHVANGGVPHDDFGKHIVGVSEQIAQLNSFSRYAANKDQLNDSAGDIIEKAKLKLETMRKYIKGLSKQKNYEAVKETFQPTETPELDDATKASLREKFTLKHMDDRVESALPLLHNIMQEDEGDKYFDFENSDEYADNVEKYGDVDKTPLTPQERQQFKKWVIDSANDYAERALEGVDEIGDDPSAIEDEYKNLIPKIKEYLKKAHATQNIGDFASDVLGVEEKFGNEDMFMNDDGYQTAVQFSQHAAAYEAHVDKVSGSDFTVKTIRAVLDHAVDDPHIASAMLVFQQDFEGTPLQKKVSRVQASESVAEDEIADPEMDAPLSAKDAEIPTPVDAAPMVQQFLSDPENKLVLRKDDTADAMLKR